MKIYMKTLAFLVAVSCFVLCFCSCGNNTETTTPVTETTEAAVETTDAVVETTDAVVETETSAETEKAVETEAVTEAEKTITEEEAIKMVEDKYQFGEGYSYSIRDIEEIDGVSYYGVDLRKIMDTHSTYLTTYFVTTDGSKIVEGYYQNDQPFLAE